jgi:predicted secreted protein
MATKLGRDGLIRISATTIGELRNYALTHTSDTVEDSVLGDTYRTRLASMKSWGVSGDLYWDENDAGQLLITIGSQVTLNLYPEGSVTGDRYYSGQALITQFNISASFDGIIEGSIAFEGTADLATVTA